MGLSGAAAGQEHAGFRELVDGLIGANLRRDPGRAMLLRRREAASLVALDAGIAVTVQMLPGAAHAPGTVLVHDGEDPWAEVVVHADSVALLEMAAVPLRFGLPDVLTATGRDVIRQIVTRRIRVRGLVRHLGTVRRLSLLLSAREAHG
ncbi:MAG TPA: hypothetical protein VJM84_05510 [Actinomycetota bacterium]|nr:hypothetical protein [Actinomycetota bacterium]